MSIINALRHLINQQIKCWVAIQSLYSGHSRRCNPTQPCQPVARQVHRTNMRTAPISLSWYYAHGSVTNIMVIASKHTCCNTLYGVDQSVRRCKHSTTQRNTTYWSNGEVSSSCRRCNIYTYKTNTFYKLYYLTKLSEINSRQFLGVMKP